MSGMRDRKPYCEPQEFSSALLWNERNKIKMFCGVRRDMDAASVGAKPRRSGSRPCAPPSRTGRRRGRMGENLSKTQKTAYTEV